MKTDEQLIWEAYQEDNPLHKVYPDIVIERRKRGRPYTETEVVRTLKGGRAWVKAKAILANLQKDDSYDYAIHTVMGDNPLRKPIPKVIIERKRRGAPASDWEEIDAVYGINSREISRHICDEYRRQDPRFVIRRILQDENTF